MNSEKIKLYTAVGVLALCGIGITWYVSINFKGYGTAKPLTTPAWKHGNQLAAKITSETRFNDVGLAVISESPAKYVVRGSVSSEADLDALKQAIQRESPDHEFEYEVVIVKH